MTWLDWFGKTAHHHTEVTKYLSQQGKVYINNTFDSSIKITKYSQWHSASRLNQCERLWFERRLLLLQNQISHSVEWNGIDDDIVMEILNSF